MPLDTPRLIEYQNHRTVLRPGRACRTILLCERPYCKECAGYLYKRSVSHVLLVPESIVSVMSPNWVNPYWFEAREPSFIPLTRDD